METIGKVRRAYWVQGKKIKAIARELHLARGTVRRIVRSGETVLKYERREQPLLKLGAFAGQLDELLAENMRKPRRERLTVKRLFEELQKSGYAGGYDAVREVLATHDTSNVLAMDSHLQRRRRPWVRAGDTKGQAGANGTLSVPIPGLSRPLPVPTPAQAIAPLTVP